MIVASARVSSALPDAMQPRLLLVVFVSFPDVSTVTL